MDLRFQGPDASAEERAAVAAGLGDESPRRDLLLPALHAAQDRFGWVPPGALDDICRRLSVPPAEAHGVVTFYHLLSLVPMPAEMIHVCDDIACRVRGAEGLCDELARRLGSEGEGGWKRSPCLGLCERAPAAVVIRSGESPRAFAVAPASAESIATEPEEDLAALRRSVPGEGGRLLHRIGRVDPSSLSAYLESGGYAGLRHAMEIGSAAVIGEISASKLMGRGGAAFPTGRKWEAVARAGARPHYVIGNADESEPGTFKDRVLMEGDPFAVIEGMTIAGLATGSERGFLYIRGEYPLALRRMADAIESARAGGWLGPDIQGSGRSFEMEIRRGAGAYICGEETALFNSIEGKRGEPRNKPPFPSEAGVFGKPTLVNNVEPLVNIPLILQMGGEAYARIGTPASTGPKLFCVSGHVERPGVYEVDFGATLGELMAMAGGVAGGRGLRAILLGGAAGVFVGPDQMAMPLTFEGTRTASATLGSGVVMAFDDTTDLGDVLLRIAAFFRDESCGQCVPCRVGTVRQAELLHRLRSGPLIGDLATELALLREIGQVMRDASICGLGQTASSAIESALTALEPFPGPEPRS